MERKKRSNALFFSKVLVDDGSSVPAQGVAQRDDRVSQDIGARRVATRRDDRPRHKPTQGTRYPKAPAA